MNHAELKALTEVVARCCEIKAEVVSQDETETGLRAILNFGHTIGHAIEAIFHYGAYLHGEAISIGQVAAALISNRLSNLPLEDVERIQLLFKRCGLPTHIALRTAQWERLQTAMKLDKKVSGGSVNFVLSERIGAASWGHPVPMDLVHSVLRQLGSRPSGQDVNDTRRHKP